MIAEPSLLSVYIALLVAAFLLVGAELYVPGGVLGTAGGICVLIAVILGFRMGPLTGWIGIGGVLLLAIFGVYFWMTVFPRSPAGRRLTLEADGQDFKTGKPEFEAMAGRKGVAQSPMRPAGVALIDGRRVDVLAEDGQWIEAGAGIRVTRVSGSRLYVEQVNDPGRSGS